MGKVKPTVSGQKSGPEVQRSICKKETTTNVKVQAKILAAVIAGETEKQTAVWIETTSSDSKLTESQKKNRKKRRRRKQKKGQAQAMDCASNPKLDPNTYRTPAPEFYDDGEFLSDNDEFWFARGGACFDNGFNGALWSGDMEFAAQYRGKDW